MWLDPNKTRRQALKVYQSAVQGSCPEHVVIDDLFNKIKLSEVVDSLQNDDSWIRQQHTYSALYVDDLEWRMANDEQRFVQRSVWHFSEDQDGADNVAKEFLEYLRSEEFLDLVSKIFEVELTDLNVADKDINTNYFRLDQADVVNQHVDESPGREVCLLLYLNQTWQDGAGGELVFQGREENKPIHIAPLFNRCVLFRPSSHGSEHWVNAMNSKFLGSYRYNVTSWYWSE